MRASVNKAFRSMFFSSNSCAQMLMACALIFACVQTQARPQVPLSQVDPSSSGPVQTETEAKLEMLSEKFIVEAPGQTLQEHKVYKSLRMSSPKEIDLLIDRSLKILALQTPLTTSTPSKLVPPNQRLEHEKCRAMYQTLSRNPEVRVTLVLGYLDLLPYSNISYDGVLAKRLAEKLQQKCNDKYPNLVACGMKLEPSQNNATEYLLSKNLVYANKTTKKIFLRLVPSSTTFEIPDQLVYDSESGRDVVGLKQIMQSQFAEQTLLNCVASENLCIYNGHSREGGGPDTYFPRLRQKHGHVSALPDVDFAHRDYKSKDKIKSLAQMLRQRDLAASQKQLSHLEGLHLFSCSSRRHFAKELKAANYKRTTFGFLERAGLTSDDSHMLLSTINSRMLEACPKSSVDIINRPLFSKDSYGIFVNAYRGFH